MSILSRLFSAGSLAASMTPSAAAINEIIERNNKPTALQQALRYSHTDHNNIEHFTVDHRALERNIYAPWGRGHLGGSSVERLI